MDDNKMDEEFIREALYLSLEKELNPEFEGVNRCGFSPFGMRPGNTIKWDNGFIGKGKKVPSRNPILSHEVKYDEKHVIVLNKVEIEWIKRIEKLNLLEDEPRIIWWFGKANYNLRDKVLELLGEFRTVQITDDIKPKVSFYIETKRREFFLDYENPVIEPNKKSKI